VGGGGGQVEKRDPDEKVLVKVRVSETTPRKGTVGRRGANDEQGRDVSGHETLTAININYLSKYGRVVPNRGSGGSQFEAETRMALVT